MAAIVDNYPLVASLDFDVWILSTADRGFGYRREIHVWLTPEDYENSGLMILIAYMLLGHSDWKHAEIRILSILPGESADEKRGEMHELIHSGRLPISEKNVEVLVEEEGRGRRSVILERSRSADLVILGFRGEALKHLREELFAGYEGLGNALFVNTRKEIDLLRDAEAVQAAPKAEPAEERSEKESLPQKETNVA